MSPCNTPILFSKKSVRLPLTHTQLFTSSYIDLIMRNILPSIPNLNILLQCISVNRVKRSPKIYKCTKKPTAICKFKVNDTF